MKGYMSVGSILWRTHDGCCDGKAIGVVRALCIGVTWSTTTSHVTLLHRPSFSSFDFSALSHCKVGVGELNDEELP
jgi:hypothetical protein